MGFASFVADASLSTFLATAGEGDRLSLEPYHVAAEIACGAGGRDSAGAAAAVAEGRKRQEQLAAEGLDGIVNKLHELRCEPVAAALLVKSRRLGQGPPGV